MSWIVILLLWAAAPFAELGIIIGLCASNGRYKREIQELKDNRRRSVMPYGPEAGMPGMGAEPGGRQQVSGIEPGTGREPGENPWASEAEMEPGPEYAGSPWVSEAKPKPEPAGSLRAGEAKLEPESADRQWKSESEPAGESKLEPESIPEPKPARMPTPEPRSVPGSLGTIALVLGVIFIVLAGLIFATTTWHALGNVSKTLLVMACAAVFFGASFMAEKIFGIYKTSNAFYILGSAFLFLTVLAAAYFRLLGPEFILDGRNRWKVLWVGSLVTEISFFGGIKRFNDRVYTQASLWGMSVSLFFLAKACSVRWNGFAAMMMVYAAVLITVNDYLDGRGQRKEGTLAELLAAGFGTFAPLHFWLFGGITVIRGLFAQWRMITEGCAAQYWGFLDRFSLFSFTLPGLAAMAALVWGSRVMAKRKKSPVYSWLLRLSAVEMLLYGAGWLTDGFIWRMAAVNLGLLILGRLWDRDSLFWDLGGCIALAVTLLNFYNDGNPGAEGLALCLAAFAAYYFRFYLGSRQWPHLAAAVCALPLPMAAKCRLDLTFSQLGLGVMAMLLTFGVLARLFHPVIEEDQEVQGGWRMDWFQILSALTILYMISAGDEKWRFVYILTGAVYTLQYTADESLKKPALSVSAVFLAAAFWQQPFLQWPEIVKLELNLLPAVCLTWAVGVIWERNQWIRVMQNVTYMICLFLLCQDVFFLGQVADALMLEGICLAVFLWAQIKNSVLWARVSGLLILLVVLFMTRDFWLSISWWVYLMAAGIGLIAFAAVTEKKRR